MKRWEAINLLRRHRDEIAGHGVRALYIFGSTARDTAGPKSDVDLFLDYRDGFSLLDLVALKERLDHLLGAKADVTTRDGLHLLLREDILREAKRVFWWRALPWPVCKTWSKPSELERATRGKTFADYKQNWLLRRAAECAIKILSEASRHHPGELKARHSYPRWRDIAGIGNVLRHEYHRVDDHIVWALIQDELPRLKSHLENMIRDLLDSGTRGS